VVGPNLDNAFRASLRDGLGRGTVQGVVERQILYPANGSGMPAKLVTGQNAKDVAAYVASVSSTPGKDTGALADAVGGGQKPLAKAQGGKLNIPADPNGRLLYVFKNAEAKPGALTLSAPNPSTVPHNIALEGGGINEIGPVGQGGRFVSTIQVTVKAGEYTFYCSVQGHRQGGMVGKLTVR
jgi:plastocyanin